MTSDFVKLSKIVIHVQFLAGC